MTNQNNIIIKGIGVSAGIAIGKIFVLKEDEFKLIERNIAEKDIENEFARIREAVKKTKLELQDNQEDLNKMLGENYAKIANAHMLILEDPIINKEIKNIIASGKNAEYAVYMTVQKISKTFDAIQDEYFRERKNDLIDVAKKIMRHLLEKEKVTLENLDSSSIVVAKNLSPSDTVSMKESMIKGFATDIGGRTSHTALVAQSLEIPAVVGLKNVTEQAKTGMTIIIDGNNGIVVLNPTQETLENYKREYEIQVAYQKDLEKFKDLAATTLDGEEIVLEANIENPDEVKSVLKHGANGIGLYRSEYMFMTRKTMPTEEEHFQSYSKIAKMMMPYEVIIRTIDLGGDKISRLGLMDIGREANPFMGLRAIRLCLKYPELFKRQLRGILRASVYGNIKIMYPMISKISEIKQANAILEQTKEELRKEGKPFDENIQVGAMIEVPSAAIISDLIAKEVDFMSIGTNDLIQYTMAVDRVNEKVADLYNPMHPAIIRLIKNIIDAGHNAGKTVGMCGEMASDPKFTPVLIGLGLDEFSMSSVQIPKIKKVIRSITKQKAKELVNKILNCKNLEEIEMSIRQFRYK